MLMVNILAFVLYIQTTLYKERSVNTNGQTVGTVETMRRNS